MHDAQKFEIRIPGFHASVDESKRVNGVPGSELPPISEEEREVARKFGMSEESYRREKLAGIYGQQRMEARALDLGTHVEEILAALGSEYRLASVTWNSDTSTWRLEIKTPKGEQNVVLSWELVDDSLDFRTKSELQRLRNMVLFGLGRQELIVKH